MTEDCPWRDAGVTCMDNIRLFAGLPAEAKEELAASALHSSHERGSILVHEGDPIESILILRTGRIKTFHSDSEGNENVLDVLHEGQAIWHGLFIEDNSYHYSVACLTDVQLCRIHRTAFEATLAAHPDAALGLIRMLSAELEDAEEKVKMLGIRDPRRRLAEFLLYRDERCVGPEIRLKLEDIAGSVGLRPETVSRNLVALEREGLVRRLGRGRLQVIDREGLLHVAEYGSQYG